MADSITATFKANTTFTTTTLGSSSVFYVGTAATPASIVINGSIVGASDGVGTVQVTNSGGNGTLFLGGKLGTSSNSLALLDVDATTILQGDNANVTDDDFDGVYQLTIADITTIDIAASTELEIKYSVVTSTIDLNGSSTLTVQSSPQLYNSSFAVVNPYGTTTTTTSIQGNITNSGDSNTLTVWSPLFQAVAQPTTFAGTVNVDTINIAQTYTGGYAIFTGSGGVTAGSVIVTGGNHANEHNLGVFNYSLTTSTIVLNKDTGDATIEFTGNNTSTITGTINGSNATEGILKVTGSGKTFSDAVGTTRSLTLIDIDESTTFSSAVVATDINNAASTTATFSDNVTATITNSGTLLFNTSADKSVTGTIAEAAGGDTTEIKVIDSADGAPATVTFTATVAADTLTVGTTSKAGAALFEDDVTVPTINITGANSGDENSTATFNTAVTATAIVLDDSGIAGTAKVIFAENNSVTITGTIDGASSDEGTIQVTGATKTFSGAIGGTQALTLIDIDNTSTFNEAISATNINVADSITATAKKAITATAIVLDGGTLVLSDNNSVTIAGTINGSNTTEGTLQITGATKTFSGAIGTTQALTLIDVDNAAIFNGSIEATTLSVAASNYALELNGAANVITNAVTFSNTGALTLGDGQY